MNLMILHILYNVVSVQYVRLFGINGELILEYDNWIRNKKSTETIATIKSQSDIKWFFFCLIKIFS